MKILITGCSGFLGRYLIKYASKENKIFAHSRYKIELPENAKPVYFDLQDYNFIEKIEKINPQLIIHNAAMAGVDQCEVEHKKAAHINVLSTKALAEYSSKSGTRLIYISTDQVFDGCAGYYGEKVQPNPVNYYGLSKLNAENEIQYLMENFVIIRGALFYGKSLGSRMSFTEYLNNKLVAGEPVNVFSDQFRSPVLVNDLAKIIWKIAFDEIKGIYHLGGPERLSRMQMGEILCNIFNYNKNLLNPVKTDSVNLKAQRGLDCSLNSEKIVNEIDLKINDFSEGLRLSFQ